MAAKTTETKTQKSIIRAALADALHEVHVAAPGAKGAISVSQAVTLIDQYEPIVATILKAAGGVIAQPGVKVACVGLAQLMDELKEFADANVVTPTPTSGGAA